MSTKKDPYSQLYQLSKTYATYESIASLVNWDTRTYMPNQAIAFRAEQIALLSDFIHKTKTSKKFKKNLSSLIDLESGKIIDLQLTQQQQACLIEWRRSFLQEAKLPRSFIKNLTRTTTIASQAWATAKKQSTFNDFSPHLEKIIKLMKQKASLLGFKDHPYDALLDLYEPGMTVSKLQPLFENLKNNLIPQIKKNTKNLAFSFLKQDFCPEKQMEFNKMITLAMGLVPENSRLDFSAHPFCTSISPCDVRMTTRITPKNLLSNIFAVIHEGGHALYYQGLPVDTFGSPLSETISTGIDESQSRFWEIFIGKSKPFWNYFFPKLQTIFPQLHNTSLEAFFSAINQISPSLIRIEADIVTYNLHVILRFEMEKEMLEGTLQVKDIPTVWNQKMENYLGVSPENDAQGCLQDIHWSAGLIGYFPTYALGNCYAAQIFATFEKENPQWERELEQGNLFFIKEWLKKNIHQWGKFYTPSKLLEKISNKTLDESFFIDYVNKKYSDLN
jgi:carboxypeptidase Taq